jgi:ubiquinone/menaquinone biosynthesis C-methylase UbiE
MSTNKYRESVRFTKKNGVYYILDSKGKIKKFKPWFGDIFSFLYDSIMEKSIFPKKFTGSIQKHFKILKNEFQHIHNTNIIEIATGSGNAVEFLNNDNLYTGIDISAGLLSRAAKRFEQYGFQNDKFYIADACNLPFKDNFFELGICNLSLNFFDDIEIFISELKRVLIPGAVFYCSVPIRNRLKLGTKIHGNIYYDDELKELFKSHNFSFFKLPYQNGALLYFKTTLKAQFI